MPIKEKSPANLFIKHLKNRKVEAIKNLSIHLIDRWKRQDLLC